MSFLSRIILHKSKAHFSSRRLRETIPNQRQAKHFLRRRGRVAILAAGFTIVYGVIGARLVQYAVEENPVSGVMPPLNSVASRPNILDRNGQLLATDIRTVSMYAEPHKMVDVDEAIEKLATVIPDLDMKDVYGKLSEKRSRFTWIKRQLTPRQQGQILRLGIPGIGFRPEMRRFYPGGSTAAHILGYVDIDNRGVAGMERFIDLQGFSDLSAAGLTSGAELEPLTLSIDVRVQNVVHDVVVGAMKNYRSKAAGAVVLDVRTGEVIAMASAPDFDPNNPAATGADGWLNRMSNGTFEMGSTFKTFSMALALDTGKVTLKDSFDATKPLRLGGFTIHDSHGGMRRWLTVPEIFRYSSNIGTAKMVDMVGAEVQREYLTKFGLLTRMRTELPEVKSPSQPKVWKKINSITISFGHGVSTTPLQTAVAGAALVNGGLLISPTFLPQSRTEATASGKRVVKASTSDAIRYLFKLNGEQGSGRRADVPGFHVGGKTGTADKVVNGRYDSRLNFNAFLAAFPIDDPQYVVLTFCDEPRTGENNLTMAAETAAPMVRNIVRRIAPMLGVEPKFGNGNIQSANVQDY
ncbi:peptidoglycan D,D-transpeptidase FtsI family protein [Rhizobium hainanense]|nr:penicillin-binding protein 2 [Rhizobium hainanense]